MLGTGALVCSDCSYSCKNCGKKIDDLAILTGDQAYCSSCFCCRSCKKKIEDLRYARTSKGLFCMPCHERLLEKKRKQDIAKKAALAKLLEKKYEPITDKNLPEIPYDSVSTSSSNIDNIMTPQLTKESSTSKNAFSSKEDHLNVILDIPMRSPQRHTLAPPATIESSLDDEQISKQSLNSSPPPPSLQRIAPYSPQNANNRKAVVMDTSNDEIIINSVEEDSNRGLNIENVSLQDDILTTPNGKKNFKFGMSGTPKSPSKDKISRSMSIKSPRNFFHRHKRSISGSLDLSSNSPKPLPTTEEEKVPTLAAYRTPPVPSTSTFGTGHMRAISDTTSVDKISLLTQTELELRTVKLEIHNLTTVKTTLKNDISLLTSEKEKLALEILEQQRVLEQLKTDIFKTNSSTTSSISNEISKTLTPPPPPPPLQLPRSSSITNLADETSTSIVQVEDIVELKQKQKPRFWRRGKQTKTKDLIISSPSNYNISKSIEETFVTNLEDNKMKLFQNMSSSGSSTNLAVKVEPRELFGLSLELRCLYEKSVTPFIITKCIEQVELRGLDIEGIYRVSGGTILVEKLENAFREYQPDSNLKSLNDLMSQDIHAVSSVLKRYLRKLPNPIIPFEHYSSFIALNAMDQGKLQNSQELVSKLPELNYKNLKVILTHLIKIYQNANANKMTLKNISVVFGPTLMRDVNPEREVIDMSARTSVLEFILSNYNQIFKI